MENRTIQILLNYAAEKHIYVDDIIINYSGGCLTLDEYYNMLAKRISETTKK